MPVTLMTTSPGNRRLSMGVIGWVFHLGSAKTQRGRAPAGNQRYRRKILVARIAALPTAFPPVHEIASLTAQDDQFETEVIGARLTDGIGIPPLDRTEIAVDQKSRADMAGSVEMLADRKCRSLAPRRAGC